MSPRAAVLFGPGQGLLTREVRVARPRSGEIRVRMLAAGICHSDYSAYTYASPWPLPIVLGHEGAGVVAEIGPGVDGLTVGDRVILAGSLPIHPAAQLIAPQRTLSGCLLGNASLTKDVPAWLDLYRDGRLKLDELVTLTVPLEGVQEGFEALHRGEVARVVVAFD